MVAAITMPTLIQNYKNELRVQRLKKAYSTWSQVFQKILADEGVERLSDTQLWSNNASYCIPAICSQKFKQGLNKYIKLEYYDDDKLMHMPDGTKIYYNLRKTEYTRNSETCKKIKELGGTMCGYIGSLSVHVDKDTAVNNYNAGRNEFEFFISNEGKLYPAGGKDYALFLSQTDLSSNRRYWKSPSADPAYKCDPNVSLTACCTARIMENGWKIDY